MLKGSKNLRDNQTQGVLELPSEIWNLVISEDGCPGVDSIAKSGILQGQGQDYQQLCVPLDHLVLSWLSVFHILIHEKESEQTLGPRI
jgi:hypothetical protein